MPSKSAKQARFMARAARDAGFAKSSGISQSVAREFNQADNEVLLRLQRKLRRNMKS